MLSITEQLVCLTVAYDGVRYNGWQRGNGRTVQGTLEAAIADALPSASDGAVKPGEWAAARGPAESAFLDGPSLGVPFQSGPAQGGSPRCGRIQGGRIQADAAGRTDAGVHASGQVVSVRLPASVRADRLLALLNERLPEDVQVLACSPADGRFHARYRARGKTYLYRIVDGPVGDPFMVRYAWRVKADLDLAAMHAAAASLIGEHDFSSLTADKSKKSKVHTITSIILDRPAAGRVDIRVSGDGFLWNQVRIMVALLVLAGQGRLDAAAIERLLAEGRRAAAPAPAPAHGLCLEAVDFGDA